jgi:hypothetical protein
MIWNNHDEKWQLMAGASPSLIEHRGEQTLGSLPPEFRVIISQ